MGNKEIMDKIEEFHKNRIVELKSNKTPKPFREGGKTVLHLIPMESFSNGKQYDLHAFQEKSIIYLKPFYTKRDTFNQEFEYGGLLNFILADDNTCLSYLKLYREGFIEAVEGFYLTLEEKNIPIYSMEQEVLLRTANYLEFLEAMTVKPPVECYLAFLGVKGYSIEINSNIDTQAMDIHPFDMEDIILPRIEIDDFDTSMPKMAELFRTSFDRVWNACGYPRSFQYDEKEEFQAK